MSWKAKLRPTIGAEVASLLWTIQKSWAGPESLHILNENVYPCNWIALYPGGRGMLLPDGSCSSLLVPIIRISCLSSSRAASIQTRPLTLIWL